MCTPRISHVPLVISFAVFVLAASARAQRHLSEVLAKGSQWTLLVNGQTATLGLLGGRGGRTADGGFEPKFEVAWGDVDGVLHAASDADNTERKVTLDLTYASGARLQSWLPGARQRRHEQVRVVGRNRAAAGEQLQEPADRPVREGR